MNPVVADLGMNPGTALIYQGSNSIGMSFNN